MGLTTFRSIVSLTATLVVAPLAACSQDHSVPNSVTNLSSLREVLTDSASSKLDASGRFVVNQVALSARREITGSRAAELAAAWAPQFGPFLARTIEAAHGEPIDFTTLRVCDRPQYAASSFQPLPDGVPKLYHRYLGPWWIVTLCNGQRAAVSLAVSAYSDDLMVDAGTIAFPAVGKGNYFLAVGVPPSWEGGLPISAEAAALRIARSSGRFVAEVPELVAPDPRRSFPHGALWRISMNAPVRARTHRTGRVLDRQQVFVGASHIIGERRHDDTVGTLVRPESEVESLHLRVDMTLDEGPVLGRVRDGSTTVIEVRRRPNYPIVVEHADFIADGGR